MDWIRGAILNALHEGFTIKDLWHMAEHAQTPRDFDNAVNILTTTTQHDAVWMVSILGGHNEG